MLRPSACLRAFALAASILHAPPSLPHEMRPPCGDTADPGYPAVDAAPNISVMRGKAAAAWAAPRCTGWPEGRRDVVVAMSGTFRHEGNAHELLERIGAITALRGTRYWSVTDRAWRELVTDASALSAADPGRRRADFSASEIASGRELYALQAETRLGEAVYRFRLRESSSERIVIESENVTALRVLRLPVFGPGDLKSVYFLERRSPGVWGYYGLVSAASAFAAFGEASFVNRTVALYRRFAGLPSDAPPLAAR